MPYSSKQLKRLHDPDLLPAARVPSLALRTAETVIKRRLFVWEDQAVRETERLYAAAYADLRNTANAYADYLGITKLAHDRKSQTFKERYGEYMQSRLSALTDAAAAEGLRRSVTAWYAGYYGRLWLLDVATHADVRIPANPPAYGIVARQTLGRLAESVRLREDEYDDLIRSLLGREWRSAYADNLDDLVLRIKRAISNGMSAGEGVPDIMRRVRTEMGVETDRRRGFHANFNRVQAITRTTINTASNNGAAAAYAANADVLYGQEWLCAKDERTCSRCFALDGTIFPLGSLSRPPAHVNCRCTLIPVIKQELQVRGDVPPSLTLEEWTAMKADVRDLIRGFVNVRVVDSERVG